MFVALAAAICGGCYLQPRQTNSPVQTPEGVRLRLLGEACEDGSSTGEEHPARTLALKVALDNPTGQPLLFAPRSLRLVAQGDRVVPVEPRTALTLRPGQSQVLVLEFLHDATCQGDFELAFNDALAFGAHPLAMASLHFSPR